MSLNPLTALLVSNLFSGLVKSRSSAFQSVLDLGTQRLRCKESLAHIAKGKYIRNPARLVAAKTAAEFYRGVGFDTYTDIDLDPAAAVIHDLNKPLAQVRLHDLIVNSGTGEHVFNQANVFRLVHDWCAVNGLMLHILPGPAGWLNHGFYAYQPKLFTDMAVANAYEIVDLGFGRRDGRMWPVPFNPPGKGKKEAAEALRVAAETGEPVFTVAVLRKLKDEGFITPYDRRYFADAHAPD